MREIQEGETEERTAKGTGPKVRPKPVVILRETACAWCACCFRTEESRFDGVDEGNAQSTVFARGTAVADAATCT